MTREKPRRLLAYLAVAVGAGVLWYQLASLGSQFVVIAALITIVASLLFVYEGILTIIIYVLLWQIRRLEAHNGQEEGS